MTHTQVTAVYAGYLSMRHGVFQNRQIVVHMIQHRTNRVIFQLILQGIVIVL